MKLTAFIDGSCFGNPGESGIGIELKDSSGSTIATLGRYIGHGTNNIAEYQALLGAIELAAAYQPSALEVFSDSELLVKQMNGDYKIKQPHLKDLHQKIRNALKKENFIMHIQHIPREKNKVADGLARKAILIKGEVS